MKHGHPLTKKILCSFLSIILILFTGCGGKNYQQIMQGPEKLFYQGQFQKAAQMLKPYADKRDKNQLLYMMEAGYMFHVAGDYDTSNRILLEAGRLAQVTPISISQQVNSLLTNQRATNYRGEDFEKVLIHMYLGMNFILKDEYDSARVEFKKVNEELSKIKTENGEARYKQNIMAKYLTALAYEIIGDREKDKNDLEYAYIELKQILALAPKNPYVRTDLMRLASKLGYSDDYRAMKSRYGSLDRGKNNGGEMVVIYQAGQSAIKVSRGKLLSDPEMNVAIRVSLSSMSLAAGVTIGAVLLTLHNSENPIPAFKKRSNRVDHLRITIGGKTYNTEVMESIEDTAVQNLKDDYSRLKKKVAISIAVKAAASVAAGIAAKKIAESSRQTRGAAGLIGFVAGMGTGAALFSSIKPDLRCWHTLPANLQMARIFLRAGKYDAVLEYVDGTGKVLKTKKINLDIKKGSKHFVNERTLF